jgi:hypothetical protein
MANMFYSAPEAAKKLGRTEADLKDLVRAGKLREFRDAGKVNYKISDVDALVGKLAPAAALEPAKSSGASQSGEIVLEAVEESGIELAPTGSDIISLEEADSSETRAGARAAKKAKEGTAVPSVGVNVFDDDELDEHVDPLAQTAVTDVAGLGIEGIGSGSGILDLTRESDDTSLGAELLEEIYTGDEKPSKAAADDTRAGLDEIVAAEADDSQRTHDEFEAELLAAPAAERTARTVRVVEYAPDPFSTALTAAVVVAVVVMWIAGLAGAAMVRGVMPSLLETVHGNLAIFFAASVLAAGLAAVVTYFVAKRSG